MQRQRIEISEESRGACLLISVLNKSLKNRFSGEKGRFGVALVPLSANFISADTKAIII